MRIINKIQIIFVTIVMLLVFNTHRKVSDLSSDVSSLSLKVSYLSSDLSSDFYSLSSKTDDLSSNIKRWCSD